MDIQKRKVKKPSKPCLLGLIASVFLVSNAYAQTVSDDLQGLGMKPELADYIAGILPAGSVLGNATYLKGRNQANSADINILAINASDDTVINSSASDDLILQLEDDANRLVSFDAASDTALVMKFGDGGTTEAQILAILSSTANGDDDSELDFSGGGGTAVDSSRGAGIRIRGNEHTSAGDLLFDTGDSSGSDISFGLNNATSTMIVKTSGGATFATFNQVSGSGGILTDDDYGLSTAPFVATVATNLTPVAGTSEMKFNTYIAPAGPTAQAIGLFGTPVAGARKCVVNESANPLIVASMGTPVVNGGTNRTTSLPTLRKMCCEVSTSATSYDCLVESAFTKPTPIGG